MTFQQGATFGRRSRFSTWSLDIGRNDPGEEVSPSPHRSCGTYFLPTSDFSTTSINFSGRDLKLTICNSPCYATEDWCQQCDLYYHYVNWIYFCGAMPADATESLAMHKALGCNHQAFAYSCYSPDVRLLWYPNLQPWIQGWSFRSVLRKLSSLKI